MESVLQNSCNDASGFLHYLYNDQKRAPPYAFGVCTKKISGRRIKARREELGLTLSDVCLQIEGLSVSRLSNWEHGRNMVSVDEAKKLAAVLDLPVAYILTIEDAEKRTDSGPDAIVNEFTYVYGACSDKGRKLLERSINAAKVAFMTDRRKKDKLRSK